MKLGSWQSAHRRSVACVLGMASCVGLGLAGCGPSPNSPAAKSTRPDSRATKPTGPFLRVGERTTRVMEPLAEDGMPDFFALVDQRFHERTSAETNAARSLYQVFGPNAVIEAAREPLARQLGLATAEAEETPASQGGHLELIIPSRASDAELSEQYQRSLTAPWTAEELPLVAAWHERNAGAIDRLADAATKDDFADPLVRFTPNQRLSYQSRMLAGAPRLASDAMLSRSMRLLAEGRTDDAFVAADRAIDWGRLQGRGLQLIDTVFSAAIDGQVSGTVTRVLANDVRFPSAVLLEWRNRLRKPPARCDVATQMDVVERFGLIDSLRSIYEMGPAAIGAASTTVKSDPTWKAKRDRLDWNGAAVFHQQWLDECVTLANVDGEAERLAAIREFENKLYRDVVEPIQPKGRLTGDLEYAPRDPYVATEIYKRQHLNALMTPMLSALHGELMSSMRRRLCDAALAAALFARERSAWPETSDDLKPFGLDAAPLDIWAKTPVKMRVVKDGAAWQVYCTGRNGIDETATPPRGETPSDDLVIEIQRCW